MSTIDTRNIREPYHMFKPSTRDESDLFYGTRGNMKNPEILIVGESWGNEERRMRLPFMGKSGQVLEILLKETGIDIDTCLFTNVVSERPMNNDMSMFFHLTQTARATKEESVRGLYPKENVINGLRRLFALIDKVQPKLIIGLGNYTLWALTGACFEIKSEKGRYVPTGIGNYRGSQLYSGRTPFLPTYHPAATFRTYAWRAMIRHDLKVRVPKALIDNWHSPGHNYIIRPSFDTVMEKLVMLQIVAGEYARAKESPFLHLAVDIETRNEFIACLGIAWSKDEAMCIPILSTQKGKKAGYWSLEEETDITFLLQKLLTHPNVRIIGQNFAFDVQYISAQMFFTPHIAEDTMIKHHCCFPGGG